MAGTRRRTDAFGKRNVIQKEASPKLDIKRKVAKALALPKEIILNLPIISLTGNEEMEIENYKGVIEYTEDRIRVNTSAGTVRLEGKSLVLRHITSENILISGKIDKIEFIL